MDYTVSERILKHTMAFLFYVYFIALIIRGSKSYETNLCSLEETCAKCIQKDPRCAWCNQEDFTERKISRCDLIENFQEKNCSDLVNPQNSYAVSMNPNLSDPGDPKHLAIQVKPLSVSIELRPNSPKTFSFDFRQVVPYAIDLYYLMDLSDNMYSHKDKLKQLGQKLGNDINKISSDISIGVGSFTDKVTSAYGSSTDNNRFPDQGFKFNRGLRPSKTDFLSEVVNVVNLLKETPDPQKVQLKPDNLTGTLDAILQAIVCKSESKWRSDAKKLIVIATGNDFHHAGDGKLKGIIEPNDGECHLNSGGHHKLQDYPSLSQINRKIKEQNITIIFAVTDDQMEVYENISNRIYGSAARKLEDHSEIMDLIREQYNEMSSSLEISDDSAQFSGNIEISYNSTCLDGVNMERNECKNVKPEDTITFDASIKFSHCPENGDKWETIRIIPVHRISTLTIELKMICDCHCNDGGVEKNMNVCSGKGTYKCGVCECENKRYGEQCECEGAANQTHSDINQCKRGKEGRICSGRGECRCGKCECYEGENPAEKYYGKYCECSNFTCYRVNNKICNGHGSCECGKCKCDEGWSGPDCTCSNTTENCLVSSDGSMCSGHGTCYCGSCKCDETYYGQFCEDCPNCPGKCEEYGTCVQCILSSEEKQSSEDNCNEACKTLTVELVDKMDQVNHTTEKICTIEDEERCRTFFMYEKNGNQSITIFAQREKECPNPPDIVAIVSGTIGSIVAAGLILLLLWKFLTYVHDKKEYAKFEKELQNAKWDSGENPFFIEPTSTFQNPAYRTS